MLHVVKRPVAKPTDISLRTGRVPNHEEGGQAWGGLHARRPSSRSRPHVWSPSKRPFCCGRPRLHPIPLSLSFDHSEASCFPSSSATAAAATGGDDDCSGSDGGGGSSRDSGSGSGGGASGSGSGGGASGSASGGGGWPRWDAAAAAVSPVTAAAGGAAADGGAAEGGELEMEDATLVTKVPARLSYVLPRRPAAVASGGGGAVAVAVAVGMGVGVGVGVRRRREQQPSAGDERWRAVGGRRGGGRGHRASVAGGRRTGGGLPAWGAPAPSRGWGPSRGMGGGGIGRRLSPLRPAGLDVVAAAVRGGGGLRGRGASAVGGRGGGLGPGLRRDTRITPPFGQYGVVRVSESECGSDRLTYKLIRFQELYRQ